jgi:hypothetical protein
MPTPPPKKPTNPKMPVAAPQQSASQKAAALRRSLSSDGFQAVSRPTPMNLETDSAATELGKAAAGINKRLTSLGTPPPQIAYEIAQLIRGPMPHPFWPELLRVILSPASPEAPEAVASEGKRILDGLQQFFRNLPRSRSKLFERLQGLGIPTAHLFHGADIVVEGGAALADELAPLVDNAPASATPFPGSRKLEIATLGTLFFARGEKGEALLRLSAHVAELQKAAPAMMGYFTERFVAQQNIGPMGCSPLALRAGRPVRVRFQG